MAKRLLRHAVDQVAARLRVLGLVELGHVDAAVGELGHERRGWTARRADDLSRLMVLLELPQPLDQPVGARQVVTILGRRDDLDVPQPVDAMTAPLR